MRNAVVVLFSIGLVCACSGPMGPIAGGTLEGDSAAWPEDWAFTDNTDNVAELSSAARPARRVDIRGPPPLRSENLNIIEHPHGNRSNAGLRDPREWPEMERI